MVKGHNLGPQHYSSVYCLRLTPSDPLILNTADPATRHVQIIGRIGNIHIPRTSLTECCKCRHVDDEMLTGQ